MKPFAISSMQAAALGGLVGFGLLGVWYFASGIDVLGFTSVIARTVHIFAAMLWVGMIWFANFVQLSALSATDDAGRAALLRYVVPNVAAIFRYASHLTLATGVVLLVSAGYLLERWVYKSAVYIPPLKVGMLLGATVAAVIMWLMVHFVITPNLRIVLGEVEADAAAKVRAGERARLAARINLILALPVTCVMVAVAHA